MQTTFHQYQKLNSTPHGMVHVPAKFRENTSMRFRVTVRKLNVTDGGRCNISHPRAYGAAGDQKSEQGNRGYIG